MSVLRIEPVQRQALIYSVGLHLGIVLLLLMSTQQTSITPPKGIAIQAEIMDLDQFLQNQPTPKKQPEPVKPEPVKPEPVKPEPPKVEPKVVEQPKPVITPPKPEPKPVVKPKIDPKKRAEKTERQKRLEELRRQRQAAEQQAVKPPPTPTKPKTETTTPAAPVGVQNGAENQRRTLLTHYIAAIQSAVNGQWSRPSGTPAGLQCQIKVNQIPGGGVIDVSIGSPCNASAVVRNSIINAVKKADPLPYKGFEEVFDRRLNFIFQYQGD